NLAPGTYEVEITDDLQCITSNTLTITEPALLTANLNVTNVSCNGQTDGSIVVNAAGGSAPYQYSIDGINFQASNSFTGLSDGIYTITVHDDSACVATQTDTISESGSLAITLDSIVDAACFGGSDGAIYTTVTGGTTPYIYQWSNSASTDDIFNLAGGS